MDQDLCLEPLLVEFFNPALFNSLQALLEVSCLDSKFRDYFQRHETRIYLRLIQARLELDARSLSLMELRQFLVRAPELFEEKEVPLTMVTLSQTPKLFLLALPGLRKESQMDYSLLEYAQRHDNAATYASIMKSYPDFFERKLDNIYVRMLCSRLLKSKAVGCLYELFSGIPERFHSSMLSNLWNQRGSRFVLPVVSKYCQTTGKTLDELVSSTGLRSVLGYTCEEDFEDYPKLVRWVLTQSIDESFRQSPITYLIAAGLSDDTFRQLLSKFPTQFSDRKWLRELFQELCQLDCRRVCLKEHLQMCLDRMLDERLFSREEVRTVWEEQNVTH